MFVNCQQTSDHFKTNAIMMLKNQKDVISILFLRLSETTHLETLQKKEHYFVNIFAYVTPILMIFDCVP